MDKRYQVFVSSTYTDLIEERKEVTQAILKCDCFPAGMELFPASNKNKWELIKKVIDDSDFYLLIIAGRYGSLGTDDAGKRVGYTEMEFDYAVSKGKPIFVLLHDNPNSLPAKFVEESATLKKRCEKFREKAKREYMVAFWKTKENLHSAVLDSLYKAKKETPEAAGWVRSNSATMGKSTNKKLLSGEENLIGEFNKLARRTECEMIVVGGTLSHLGASRSFLNDISKRIKIRLLALNIEEEDIERQYNKLIERKGGVADLKHLRSFEGNPNIEIRTFDLLPTAYYVASDLDQEKGVIFASHLFSIGSATNFPLISLSRSDDKEWYEIYQGQIEGLWKKGRPWTSNST